MKVYELYYCGKKIDEINLKNKAHATRRLLTMTNFEVREKK